ncbi:hypothetical protein LX36DRAFT_667055 [Colletotrichum falcatum]|nr:hypothetical protein LX36DRAFT_667055 [Colletotrichum falcatum]
MEEFGIILLSIFAAIFACGVLHRPVCLAYMRVQEYCKYHPRASQFRDARRKLGAVSECTTAAGAEKQDLESGLSQDDAEAECPICIGPLFVTNKTNEAGTTEQVQAMPSQIPGGASGVPRDGGGQAGAIQHVAEHAAEDGNVKAAASKWGTLGTWAGRLWGKSPVKTCMRASDDDILRLKGCQHAFHAKCLASWFLIDRYDCPVCRNPYWQSREEKARAAHAPAEPEPDGGDGEHGIARPAPARIAVARPVVPVR